jgi:2-dehydro-3-deoxyglucarate aldolase/4-hydroxy-2-oxoheptanedioate aldolase
MYEAVQRFRAKLAAGELCFGTGVNFVDPAVSEALAPEVDFLWLDMEHSAIGFEALRGHLQAARAAGGAACLVRVPSSDIAWTKRALDIGAEAIILPRVRSVDEVRELVSACRYPPEGTRGFGPHRAADYGRISGPEYMALANRSVLTIAQIEDAAAVRVLDGILAVPGLDSLVLGPNDLAGSMGHPGKPDHPEVLDAIRHVCSQARAAGIPVGSGLGASREFALRLVDLGVQWLQCGGDYSHMLDGQAAFYRGLRLALGER